MPPVMDDELHLSDKEKLLAAESKQIALKWQLAMQSPWQHWKRHDPSLGIERPPSQMLQMQ